MTDEVIRKAFAPFFSAKSAGRTAAWAWRKALRWIENHGWHDSPRFHPWSRHDRRVDHPTKSRRYRNPRRNSAKQSPPRHRRLPSRVAKTSKIKLTIVDKNRSLEGEVCSPQKVFRFFGVILFTSENTLAPCAASLHHFRPMNRHLKTRSITQKWRCATRPSSPPIADDKKIAGIARCSPSDGSRLFDWLFAYRSVEYEFSGESSQDQTSLNVLVVDADPKLGELVYQATRWRRGCEHRPDCERKTHKSK